ncbi:unnamed protein product [Didymodactylos carnosus]|uniref:BZIP domain-containing protein n=3 Tax=Didymodactylos carnosus TaxID=1234261 RepID=A0A813YC37_9BILA|nr:unnamed protein product [Didymodactylos carnosus]CAF3668094.1 unnamed protein product [Didymodactylos carnosus]
MGKRGRKAVKTDSNTKLEKSRQSARECRHRKKLRYEYLEELVSDREKAIYLLQRELQQVRTICQQLDKGEMTDDIRKELNKWEEDPELIK